MLLLVPGRVRLLILKIRRGLLGVLRGPRLEIIRGQGHEIHLDQAEACQEKLLIFLEGSKGK